jgi:hypothetical protein
MFRHDQIETLDEYGRPVVVERGRRSRFVVTPAQIVSAVAGVALVAVGLFAIIRAGLSGPLNDPTVQVLGIDHTAWVGLVEVAVGAVLVLCAFSPLTRPLIGLIGLALVAAGIVLLAGPQQLLSDLHTEEGLGWVAIVPGAAVLLAALITPRRTYA